MMHRIIEGGRARRSARAALGSVNRRARAERRALPGLIACMVLMFSTKQAAALPKYSIHSERQAFRVAVELGSVHALDVRDTGLVFATMLDARAVLEDVNALGQVIDEEVAGGVARAFVIGEAVLVFVLAEHVHRLGAAAALVLEMDVFHVAIDAQLDADDQFVADLH